MKTDILYLVPDFFVTSGGIARHSRLVSQALYDVDYSLTILALHDPRDVDPQQAATLPDIGYQACQNSRSRFIAQAFWLVLQRRPQLILVAHPHFAGLGHALQRLSGARMAVFIHGIEVWAPLPRSAQYGILQADRVLAVSRFTARKAVEHNGLTPDRIRILHNCLDPQVDLTVPQPRCDGIPSLLTVARMSLAEQYKGHDVVLRAMPELLRRFPNLCYDIVGDGDARPGLQGLAQQLGISDAVRFHGIVSEAALRDRYAQASLFIMPSRAEGFGFVFLEAMAQGLPVVAGNVDATPEVVVHGETGLLVTPTSVDEIVEAVSRLLEDDALRQRTSEAARQHVAARFSYAAFQRQLVEELSQIAPFISSTRLRSGISTANDLENRSTTPS